VRRQQRFNSLPVQLKAARRPPLGAGVDEQVALRSVVHAALHSLSGAEREVIELAYWGGLPQSQIAAALGIPVGTVKSRTFNALAKLRDSLRETNERLAG
jgi:RNA polymerase sigma factor (sigma-70 family)